QDTSEIVCLHAPLRSRSLLESKADLARPIEDIEEYLGVGWHLRRWRRLVREGRLAAEWAANSYLDGQLHRQGGAHSLVFDGTLRDLVAPFIHPNGREQPPLGRVPFQVPAQRQASNEDDAAGANVSAVSGAVRRRSDDPPIWGISVVRNEVDIIR